LNEYRMNIDLKLMMKLSVEVVEDEFEDLVVVE
jgi:hypothetical protein